MAADLLNERLPPEWSYAVTSDGRVFFVSERQCETSWLHPVTGRPVQTGHQAAPGLPNGWEQDFTPEGVTFFIDHKNQQTTFSHPVTGRPVSEENPPLPPSSPPQSPNDRSELKPGTANAKQRSIKAPSAKRNPTAQVVRRGFLYRLESGGISKSWKRRWCVLADFALYIYKSDDEKASLGSVLLPSYRINRCTAQDPVQKEFAFKVEHENTKTVYFHTDTQTDLDSWLGNLQMAATMRGSTGSGFYREANNNNIKPGMGQRSPPYADQRRDYPETSNRSPQGPDPDFHPQWKNPHPNHHTLPGRGAVPPPQGGQPTWRSVPDLDRDGRDPSRDPSRDPRVPHRDGGYDPQGSMRSLPREVNQIQGFPSPNLRQDLRKFPQYQSFDPRLAQPARPSDLDPRGSVRSLQADPRKVPQEFVPLAQSGGRDRGFQPYHRPTDPQQRSSMVSDPGRRGAQGQGSPQWSPQDLHPSQGSFQGSYRPQEAARNGGYMPSHGRSPNDVSPRDTNRNSWRGSKSGPQEFEPQHKGDSPRGYPDSNRAYPDPGGSYPDPNRGYPDSGRGYPDRSPHYPDGGNPGERFSSGSNPRLSTSRDPRASYASSRHSMASQGYVGDRERDNQGSKQNLYPPYHTSRNSLARPEPSSLHPPPHLPSPHNAHGHTYMNVPEMRSAAQQFETSPGPERPPYPAAVRDQIVRDLADTRSPATAEKLIAAHELNKERMQQSAFFQYPTPPRDGTASRLDESRTSDPVKRLSQYSDRNSLASNSAMRNNDPANTSNRSQRGSYNDYSDGGRRQDSGSGRFSDSFERRSGDERRPEHAGMGGPNLGGVPMREEGDVPAEMRFGGDPEAKTLRQAYERVQSFRQSSVADGFNKQPPSADLAHRDFTSLGEGHYSASFPKVGTNPTGPGDSLSESEAASRNDLNFFEYSTNSQISMGNFLSSQFSSLRHSAQTQGAAVKPQFAANGGRGNPAQSGYGKDDLEVSHNTTLSPSGSYHHINRDPDQLYRRGSAFRPPSSNSGSVQGNGLFHSLPRSYKFKSILRAPKGSEVDGEDRSGNQTHRSGTVGDTLDGSNGDWEWYKANYLSPTHPVRNNTVDARPERHKQPRSVSDLGLGKKQIIQKRNPANEELLRELRAKFAPVKPARTMLPVDNYGGSCFNDSSGRYETHDDSRIEEPFLQSWPRQELTTARQLDVPTPTSLSSHPFFVPEDHPVSPPPHRDSTASDGEDLTPRKRMDKELREDLDDGVYAKLKARDGMNRRPIQTVREEPDMPDAEVLETKLKKKYPLNGTRLRMSISAGDLIGKTHDELVLLLIQLRRNQAALEKARDFYRESLGKKRPAEREYRRQRNDSVGGLERSLEESHQSFVDIRSQMEEVDKKLEVYRPLINLVDNMVTMGSLYGGDNLMLATQYRKHLLRPDQYQPPRKMLEFSRQHQEDKVIAGIENDVRQLTATEVDLEEKVDRLNQLERLLQEQSFKVASFREDRELLEKALHGITRQMREYQESPRDVRRLQQQQASVEKELSRVTQDLAEASKALEETTVENNKIEHEVSLLRTKVHGELKRSKSAPSLATENANNKQKMERELARVQNMLQGLSQQGEKLSQQMSTIRRSSSGTQLAAAFDEAENARKGGTYLQTDLDSGQQVDLAQQIPGHSPVSPVSPLSPNSDRPIISHQRQETTYGANTSMSEGDSRDWDIGDADDNTKRFYGLLPKEKPRGLTVRDVKRQAEQRRERKRDEEDLTLKVSSTDDDSSTFIHARYPSYASSQSSGLDLSARDPNDPSSHLYENLPRSDSMPALHQNGSAPSSRRSSISLMAPKPFTPYQDRTVKPFRSELALNSSEQSRDMGGGGGSMFAAGKPFASEMALNSGWDCDRLGYQNGGDLTVRALPHEPLQAGQVGVVSARPLQTGRSVDNIADLQPGVTRATALPTYTRVPQPFRRDPSGVSQSTPHLNALDFSPSPFVPFNGTTRPEGENVSRVYAPRPWAMDRADITPGLYDVKKSPKGRYMTISSSQPSTMEPGSFMNPAMHSSAGDLISNVRVDDVPDVVKSSLSNVDKIDLMDTDMIDREILYFPGKVVIPERYDAEADAEHLTEAEKSERQEKAERIKRLLTNQSVLSMSQPDVNKVPPGQLHNEVLREKKERAHILTLNQELARQVTRASKRAAAERRKTWSGGQFADIKAQYEAERATSPDQFDSPSRVSRHANILL